MYSAEDLVFECMLASLNDNPTQKTRILSDISHARYVVGQLYRRARCTG